MTKADQFYLAAETIAETIEDQDIADAYLTLCVHAGIAAADGICCPASANTPKATTIRKR